MAGSVAGAAAPGRGRRVRSIIGGSAGNLVEWYDWYAYSAFTLYFAPQIFPAADKTSELLTAALVFAGGFLIRPIGAWAMGVYSDRHGRKAGLALSVTLMCAGSLIIAACPTYAQIGWGAPLIVTLARLLQGLSVGGEYGAGATYLSEIAGKRHRGFFASFQYVTLISGQLVAILLLILLQSIMSEAALEAWGWRIPFLIGGVLAVSVFWLRRGLMETESFTKLEGAERARSGLIPLLREHPRETATVLLLTAGGTLAFYAFSIYMQKFLVDTSGFSREVASRINAGSLIVFMLLQPAVGALSDRIGRRPLLIAFGIAGTLLTYPIFSTVAVTRDAWTAFLLVTGALVIVSGYSAISGVLKAEMFPAHIRTLGVALPYAIANAVFGGTAETMALGLKKGGWADGFYWYVTIMIAGTLITALLMRDTRRTSRIMED